MRKLKCLVFLGVFVVLMIVYSPISKAASLTISTSQSTAKEGDTVTITVNGSGVSGRVDLSVTNGNASLSDNSVWVDNSKVTTTLKINGAEDVKVLATPTDVSDSSTSETYTTATSATIKVTKDEPVTTVTTTENTETNNKLEEETKKSNNANLRDLGITPNDFKGFKSGTTSYEVTVPNDVEKVNVYAKAQDSKATIKGTGNQKLNVGKNALSVQVTAEDGTKKTYTINVTREENSNTNENNTTDQNTTTVTETKQTEIKGDLEKLEVEGYTLTPSFAPNIYEYKLTVNKDVNDIKIITKGKDDNIKIEVAGNTNLKDGENIVTVLVYNEQTKENSTYQIKVNKEDINIDDLNEQISNSVKKAKKIRYILFGIGGFIIAGIIVFFIGKHRFNTRLLEEDKYEYEDDEKINLDDEEELFHRVNKEIFTKSKKEEQPQEDKIEIEKDNEKEEKMEFFRTTKKRGKHFE